MAVFRVKKDKNYTVMSNYHLRDKELSLRAKGLLSLMLSLPEDWDYSLKGLTKLSKEGIDVISVTVKELESRGYIKRIKHRNEKGQFGQTEYIIYEKPDIEEKTDDTDHEAPKWGFPDQAVPDQAEQAQINTKELNKDLYLIYLSYLTRNKKQRGGEDRKERKLKKERDQMAERRAYDSIIRENISYDALIHDCKHDKDIVNEIVEIILDALSYSKPLITIGGITVPSEAMKSRLLTLNIDHIKYVIACLWENKTRIANIKKYILSMLYNAPATIKSYYTNRVMHDMYDYGYD